MTRQIQLTVAAAALLGFVGPVSAGRTPEVDTATAAHVLNRVAFGARPGDVERVQAMGLERYIDAQLHPERIDDSAMARRLEGLATLGLSTAEIAERYEQPMLEARRARQAEAAATDGEPKGPDPLQQQANRPMLELGAQKVLRAVYSERQLQEVLVDFWFNHFNVDARKGRDRFLLPAFERDTIRPHVLGRFRDLLGATAKSPAMLFYLDNWMSVDPGGPHPPAMRVRHGFFGRSRVVVPATKPAGRNAARGLNENYGRELMELHTLGVDGGYTQKDVTEVARCFTGWTLDRPRDGAQFRFDPRVHDDGEKRVLGHRIPAGGVERDGEIVLDLLARHPSTARFIATKLVRRFVGDTPPAPLVDRAAARFRETDGDLREVVRTILLSREFLSADARLAKVKTPFEFVVSALRAGRADVNDATPVVRALQQLGMPLYQCQPPTGYADTADAWLTSGGLVNRMNFALALASGRMRDVVVTTDEPPRQLALRLGSPEFQRR